MNTLMRAALAIKPLGVLKILGILVLALLAVILCLLILILVLPIRYEAVGKAEKPDFEARGKIRAFLGILTLGAQVSREGFGCVVKVFGIPVLRRGHRNGKTDAGEEDDVTEPEESPLPETEERDPGEESSGAEASEPENAEPEASDSEEMEEPEEAEPGESASESPEQELPESVPPEREKPDAGVSDSAETNRESTAPGEPVSEAPEASKLRRLWAPKRGRKRPGQEKSGKKKPAQRKSGKKKPEKKKKTSGGGSPAEKAKGGADTLKSVWDQIHDPVNQKMFRLVKREAIRILKHVRPRTIRIRGVVGTGDPAQTGWILGFFYMLYPLYYQAGEFRLAGDFENRTLQGRIYLKGRVIPGVPAASVIRLLLDKDIRRLVREKFL